MLPLACLIQKNTGADCLKTDRCVISLMLFDVVTVLACSIIGALGLASILTLSPTIAYSLVGISGTFVLSWVILVVIGCFKNNETKMSSYQHEDSRMIINYDSE